MATSTEMWERAAQPQQGYAATSNPYYVPHYEGPKLWVDNGVSTAVTKWDEEQVQKRKAEKRRKQEAMRRGRENLYDNY